MSIDDQIRWDAQHLSAQGSGLPSPFLRQLIEGEAWPLPPGRALDIACGRGRNAIFLAQRGFAVTALDISPVALAEGRRCAVPQKLRIDWQQCDLAAHGLPSGEFDLLINFNFLQRSLFPSIRRAVKLGGHVIFETFYCDQAAVGQPRNPDHLLRYNELLEIFHDWRVLWYREGSFSDGGLPAFRAGIFAQRLS